MLELGPGLRVASSREEAGLIARIGDACARWAERWIPHPFVFALVLGALVIFAGTFAWSDQSTPALQGVLAAWFEGFWSKPMLAFGFQMALILVTGYALADAPPVRRALERVASLWSTPAQAALLVTFASTALSWIHWGLGLAGAAFLAREVGRSAARRGLAIPYPVIVAGAYVGFIIWHAGLSGSAPLVVAQETHPQAELVGAIPVGETLFTLPNLALSLGLLVWLPALMALIAKGAPASPAPAAVEQAAPEESEPEGAPSPATRLAGSRLVALTGLLPAAGVLFLVLIPGWISGARGLDLNVVLFIFLLGALALHGSAAALSRSVSAGAGEVGGILLQFPFYFALLGVMRESGLVALLAEAGTASARGLSEFGLPAEWSFQVMTFLSAGLVNLFVPSGGGQWAVQGEIVLRAALDPEIGLAPGRAVMALAYGDAWTNLLQPFWALALLSVTHTKARQILGYTMAAMALTFPIYLLVFAL